MPTLIHQRVRECRSGANPRLICRVRAGWVVLGDVQFVRGYSLVLPDPVVPDLNALDEAGRRDFLLTMATLGDVLLETTGALRINYEILGNQEPALHGHVFPRFADEPPELRTRPVWFYDWTAAPPFDPERDRELMQQIGDGLRKRGLAP
jgi:diadenosine tetraphosphate (Ap4A) HIT family hydrolase